MNVYSKLNDKRITIIIEGSIDSTTSFELHDELSKLSIENADEVEIDFSKTHYVSSAGLRELLILQKRFKQGRLKIKNVNANVLEIFNITGFSDIFDISSGNDDIDYSIYSFKEFLAKKVQNFGDEIILNDTFMEWSWNDLDKASDIIAEDLINLGAKKGSHIAICGGNSLNWIATFYAIQKIGAMAILVNPLLKEKEVCFLSHVGDIEFFCYGLCPWLKDDPMSFLKAISDPTNSQIKKLYDITKPINVNERQVSVLAKNFLSSIEVRNDDPCVMIFTSGSTGVPKGVLLSSYNMLTAAKCGTEVMESYDNDVMCLVLPLFHIFGLVASLTMAILCNMKVIFPPRVKPDIIIELTNKYKCTVLMSVPTLLMGIATSPEYSVDKISSLRFCGIGGAPVSEIQMLYLNDKFPNTSFAIVYGLSEMSPVSVTKKNDTIEHITKTVGQPISLIKVKIQDVETKEECKNGETGEILIKGTFLMSGYYKTPIEKQDFDSDGWFHTGDLGYLDKENYIHFAGRKKELIIRGGENIFPGEIQDQANAYKDVFAAQIIGLPDDYYGEIVGCALVLKENVSFNEEDFKSYLKEHLAPHKIPACIFVYDAFPLLANGKVDVLSLKKDMISRIK